MLAYFVCPWVIPPCILYYHLSGDDSRRSLSRHWIKRGSAERVIHRVSLDKTRLVCTPNRVRTWVLQLCYKFNELYVANMNNIRKIFTSRLATVILAYYFIHIKINFDLISVPENNLRYIHGISWIVKGDKI